MKNKILIDEISEVFEDLEKENNSLEVLISEVNTQTYCYKPYRTLQNY